MNILFVVWDTCRLDYATEFAPNLRELGDSGLWFRNAVAPATWSLPSHASFFTGMYPHEHGIVQPSQNQMPTDLILRLKESSYSCHTVSGNSFVSSGYGFDKPFDSYHYTRTPPMYKKGLNAYDFINNKSSVEDGEISI